MSSDEDSEATVRYTMEEDVGPPTHSLPRIPAPPPAPPPLSRPPAGTVGSRRCHRRKGTLAAATGGAVLSYTFSGPKRRHNAYRRTQFLQQWNRDWKCYINIDSLEEMVAGDRLTVARRLEKPADCSVDDLNSDVSGV